MSTTDRGDLTTRVVPDSCFVTRIVSWHAFHRDAVTGNGLQAALRRFASSGVIEKEMIDPRETSVSGKENYKQNERHFPHIAFLPIWLSVVQVRSA